METQDTPSHQTYVIPGIIEPTNRSEDAVAIYSRLLEDRMLFITTPIDDAAATLITAQLLFLQSEDPEQDIYMYINSPGGVVYAGLAIYDTMQHVSCEVATMCLGFCGGLATTLLAGGTPGKRFATPDSTIQFSPTELQNRSGYHPDVLKAASELGTLGDRTFQILATHTGHPVEEIRSDSSRGRMFTASEAIQYGLIDALFTEETNKTSDSGEAAWKLVPDERVATTCPHCHADVAVSWDFCMACGQTL